MDETSIREGMDVIGSAGIRPGTVDHLEGRLIKLRKDGTLSQEQHFVPLAWVERIDAAVYLEGAGKALARSAAGATQVPEVDPHLIASTANGLRQGSQRVAGGEVPEATADVEQSGTVARVKSFGDLP